MFFCCRFLFVYFSNSSFFYLCHDPTFMFLSFIVTFIHINDRWIKTFHMFYRNALAQLIGKTLHGIAFLFQEERNITGFRLATFIHAFIYTVYFARFCYMSSRMSTIKGVVVGYSTWYAVLGIFLYCQR